MSQPPDPHPVGTRLIPPRAQLQRLAGNLDRWGSLLLQVAQQKDPPAVEQVLGGLVEWMGSDLLDGWLHLPIPVFETLSDLSEELFRACEGYLIWLRQAPRPIPEEDRRIREEAIRRILDRVHALAESPGGNPPDG
ncbi:MAG TPA: hypothetical protein VLG48_04010 [Candidatus Methylomirabilis sp.]|nr:hypothetical protein [Candidatus Methylomirabilis sp.]